MCACLVIVMCACVCARLCVRVRRFCEWGVGAGVRDAAVQMMCRELDKYRSNVVK